MQALIHKYETFKRADGHTVKLPMDRGEGQQWARAPGNPYSTPQSVTIDPKAAGTVAIKLDQVIPPLPTISDISGLPSQHKGRSRTVSPALTG